MLYILFGNTCTCGYFRWGFAKNMDQTVHVGIVFTILMLFTYQ